MELEDIVNEEMLTTEDVNNMLEHTDKGRTKQTISTGFMVPMVLPLPSK